MFKLLKYLKSNIVEILIILIFLVSQVWLQLMLPEQMGEINGILTNETITDKVPVILEKSLYMALTALGIFAIAILTGLLLTHTAAVLGKRIRTAIYGKVNMLSLSQYDHFGTASLITRTTNDVEQVKNTYYMGLRIMIVSPLTLIIAIIRTLMESADLIWVLVFSIPALLVLVLILLVIAYPKMNLLQKIIDRITVVFRSQLKGVRVIRAFNRQDVEKQQFLDANKNSFDINMKIGRLFSISFPLIFLLFNLSFIGIYLVGFYFINGDSGTAVEEQFTHIMVVSQYVMQILMSFVMLAMILINIPRAFVSSKRINEVLDTKLIVTDPVNPVTTFEENKVGEIEFKNVTFKFDDASEATVSDLSFVCKKGTTTAIIGSTGSGKSTIINLIPRFHDVTAGEVLVNGVNVKEMTQEFLRDQIGFIPQKALLFSGTIKSNMLFGNDNATDEEIIEALDVARAKNFVLNKEGGLNAPVAQGGSNFSGGQKQRLSIARALVKKAPIYIFDDAFSALDFKTDAALRANLKNYAKHSSVIIVAQRVSTITSADNIIVLNDGRISGMGTHKELLKSNKVYQEIVESQS